ncbi:MAG: cytochrome-c peroxidase [Thermoguttaceae bacterium]|nr:cytochrome-c peroxidase [Thermoguttaceae bacterium]MDW8078701.1 cytochrome-c peroxidase [Thermoguttaceae bacterium]
MRLIQGRGVDLRSLWRQGSVLLTLAGVSLLVVYVVAGCGQPAQQAPSPPAAQPSAQAPAAPAKQEAPPAAPKEEAYVINPPLGLPPVPIPADNPMTKAKVELGKMLYFDTRLSADRTISCATCHDPQKAWAEDRPTSVGFKGQLGPVNSPTVINTAYARALFWDGRAASLEEQALGPIENPKEMGHSLEELVKQLSEVPEYVRRFQEAFGTGVTKDGIAKAIAAFERTILSGNSPYDRYQAGDKTALSEEQVRGLRIFEDNCAVCHSPPLFSNYQYYNAGIGLDKEPSNKGRMAVTGDERDFGKFRVPPLREVAKTAPYFHDGSVATLEEAVRIMAQGGIDNPRLAAQFKTLKQAQLSDQDIKDLVAFLNALSGEYPIVEPPQLP